MLRVCHPQEDHFVPLFVALGAAETEKASRVYHDENIFGGVTASSYRMGDAVRPSRSEDRPRRWHTRSARQAFARGRRNFGRDLGRGHRGFWRRDRGGGRRKRLGLADVTRRGRASEGGYALAA